MLLTVLKAHCATSPKQISPGTRQWGAAIMVVISPKFSTDKGNISLQGQKLPSQCRFI